MKSILQFEKECFVCKTTQNLQEHHVFEGTANRKISEKEGLKVWLCQYHHTGDIRGNKDSVHFNKDLEMKLKQFSQSKWERKYLRKNKELNARENFIKLFGKNWL